MQQLGKIFQKFRKARGLSLKEISKAGLSTSQLSRFEHGESDMTITKFMQALDEINLSITEFMYVAHEFQLDELSELLNKVNEYVRVNDVVALKRLLISLLENENKQTKFWKLNIILVKSKLQKITGKSYCSNQEVTQLTEYLFEMEYWGHYELLLFMNTLDILDHQSFMLLSREMVRRSDFYKSIPENRYLVSMMLLQGYLACIEQDELTDALYFEQRLKDCFFTEVEIYERLIFYFGKNLYQYKKTENYKSLIEVHKCLGVMRLVSSDHLATFYEQYLKNITLK